jgi:transcriptional regulator with XRE-family HTH domain
MNRGVGESMGRTQMPKAYGKKIKDQRNKNGWSQEDLAIKAGLALMTIVNAEKDHRLNPATFTRIAKALGVEVADILWPEPDSEFFDGFRFRGSGSIDEQWALGDDEQVEGLTRRCYYGKIANATLTIRGTEATLILDKVTLYDDPSCSKGFERSSHRLEGHGPVVDGSANILYTVKNRTQGLSWAGVCVLSVPRYGGEIHGHWMTAGQIERGKTVLGTLVLKPRVKRVKRNGQDQGEG